MDHPDDIKHYKTQELLEKLVNVPDPDLVWTTKGIIALIVAPFCQGFFYGLGEGIAKIGLGFWFGLDPAVSLGRIAKPRLKVV